VTPRTIRVTGLTLGIAVVTSTAAWPAPPGPRDPDWPCEQIKVPQLSLAAVWSGPSLDQKQVDWQQDQQVADLVQDTAQRRVPIEQAQEKVQVFAAQAGDQKQARLLRLLAGLFSVLDEERNSVIAGLDRFGARQKQLAEELRDDNEKLHTLQADTKSDAGDINQMTQRVTWEAQVYQDRRQALRYACDVPSKIEQRLFALARTIQDAMR
jgi:hypothetical protein